MTIRRNTATLSTGLELSALDMTPLRRGDVDARWEGNPKMLFEHPPLTLAERVEIADYMKARWDDWSTRG